MPTTQGETPEDSLTTREKLYETFGLTYEKVVPSKVAPLDFTLLLVSALVLLDVSTMWVQAIGYVALLVQALRLFRR